MSAQFELFQCLSDNFGLLAHDPETGATASFDAPDADQVLAALDSKGWRLTHVLITHHHHDHIGGAPALKARFPDARVIGALKDFAPPAAPRSCRCRWRRHLIRPL